MREREWIENQVRVDRLREKLLQLEGDPNAISVAVQGLIRDALGEGKEADGEDS